MGCFVLYIKKKMTAETTFRHRSALLFFLSKKLKGFVNIDVDSYICITVQPVGEEEVMPKER